MESSKKIQVKRLSRRGFLKGMAIATAASQYSSLRSAEAADSKDADKLKTWKTPPDPIPDARISKTIEADVVILGGGIAGVAAARSAAETGVSVAVVERQPEDKYPFFGYAAKNDSSAGAMVTLAGLLIDENQRVLDENDDPIPGLYATGNCSGGRYSADYITPISGNSIGWPFTMGRIAGRFIAGMNPSQL